MAGWRTGLRIIRAPTKIRGRCKTVSGQLSGVTKTAHHEAGHFTGVGCGRLKDEGRVSRLTGHRVGLFLELRVHLLRAVRSGYGSVMVVDLRLSRGR